MITKSDIMPIRGTAIIRPAFPYTGKKSRKENKY